jgi:acyl carrier protein
LRPDSRDEIRAAVKEVILTVKPLEDGFDELADDAPLFEGDEEGVSPVAMDSLDTLDMTLALSERFGLDDDQFERLVGGEIDLEALRTVNDIVDFIVSMTEGEPAPLAERA